MAHYELEYDKREKRVVFWEHETGTSQLKARQAKEKADWDPTVPNGKVRVRAGMDGERNKDKQENKDPTPTKLWKSDVTPPPPPPPPAPAPAPPRDDRNLVIADADNGDTTIWEDDYGDGGLIIIPPPEITTLPTHEKSGGWDNHHKASDNSGSYKTSGLDPESRPTTSDIPISSTALVTPTGPLVSMSTYDLPFPYPTNKHKEHYYAVPTATGYSSSPNSTGNTTIWLHTDNHTTEMIDKIGIDVKFAVGMGIMGVVLLLVFGSTYWIVKRWIGKRRALRDLEKKGEKDNDSQLERGATEGFSPGEQTGVTGRLDMVQTRVLPLPPVLKRPHSGACSSNLPAIPTTLTSFSGSSSSQSVRSNSTRTITSQTSHVTNDTIIRAKRDYQSAVARLAERRMYSNTGHEVADGFRLAPPNPFEDHARIPDSGMGGVGIGVAGLGAVNGNGQAVPPPSPCRLTESNLSDFMEDVYVADGFRREPRRGDSPPPNPFEDPTIDGDDQGAEGYVADGFMGLSHPRGTNIVVDNPFDDRLYGVDEKRLSSIGRIPEPIEEVDYVPGNGFADYVPGQHSFNPITASLPSPPRTPLHTQQTQIIDRGSPHLSPSNSHSRRSQHSHRYSVSSITYSPSRAGPSSPLSIHHSNSLSRSSIYTRRYGDSHDAASLSGYSNAETLRGDDDASVVAGGR